MNRSLWQLDTILPSQWNVRVLVAPVSRKIWHGSKSTSDLHCSSMNVLCFDNELALKFRQPFITVLPYFIVKKLSDLVASRYGDTENRFQMI